MKEIINEYNKIINGFSPDEILQFFITRYPGQITFSTSLGAEDQVLTDMICRLDRSLKIFTLDTGRLFQETYDLIHITERKYGIRIRLYFPDASQVEKMVAENGINLFYDSVGNRKLCCEIRKIEPLKRALYGMKIWITGLRREQSVTRKDVQTAEWDEASGLIKVSPLIGWSEEQVWEYIRQHNIPYNELHDKGYPSIGCLPCTRTVQPGESVRSGRWWWEQPENKECGLH